MVVATSEHEAIDLSGWIDRDRLVQRRNGIDLNTFKELPSGAEFRKRHQFADDERLVLYLGRISPIKNLLTLVRAFARADPANSRLIIVGPALEPDYLRDLRTLITSLALDSRVIIDQPVYGRHKLAALAAADLFVLPSLSENFGNAAAEAAAAGISVLLTTTCGVAPIIHGRAGLAVPPTEEGLAEGLCIMLNTSAKLDGASRFEIWRDLSWDEPLEQMRRVYASALARRLTREGAAHSR
jgi:glycosyltransferase involved in cell wall biosynthesis